MKTFIAVVATSVVLVVPSLYAHADAQRRGASSKTSTQKARGRAKTYGAYGGGRSSGAAFYANCSAARAAGAAPVRRGDPGYSRKLDRDNDGVGCE